MLDISFYNKSFLWVNIITKDVDKVKKRKGLIKKSKAGPSIIIPIMKNPLYQKNRCRLNNNPNFFSTTQMILLSIPTFFKKKLSTLELMASISLMVFFSHFSLTTSFYTVYCMDDRDT